MWVSSMSLWRKILLAEEIFFSDFRKRIFARSIFKTEWFAMYREHWNLRSQIHSPFLWSPTKNYAHSRNQTLFRHCHSRKTEANTFLLASFSQDFCSSKISARILFTISRLQKSSSSVYRSLTAYTSDYWCQLAILVSFFLIENKVLFKVNTRSINGFSLARLIYIIDSNLIAHINLPRSSR